MSLRALPADPMQVAAEEYGLLRLFSVEPDSKIGPDDVPGLLETDLDPMRLEVAELTAIAAMGLPAYLAEGYGIAEPDLMPDTDRLAALKGQIVLIPSSAIGAKPDVLKPRAPLRFVGIYREASAAPPSQMTRRTPGNSAPDAPVPSATSSPRRPWLIALAALSLAVALVLLAVL
ncbi:MAG: hypothetical protein AAF762_05660 [Pseudomonadota bacterium]